MNRREFAKSLDAVSRHLLELERLAGTPSGRPEVPVAEVLEDWRNTLEELRTADEELRVQNEELIVAREAFEGERRRYQELFELASDGYLVTDGSGLIREANVAATAMLNLPPKGLVRKPLAVYVTREDRKTFRAYLEEARKGSPQRVCELSLKPRQRPPFPVIIVATASRVPKNHAASVRWMLRDITERREMDDGLREREAALRGSQEDLRALTAQLVTAHDEERRRISRDLHDDFNQRLARLLMDIEAIPQPESGSGEKHRDALQTLHRHVVDLSDDLRRLAYRLHPSILEDLGLRIALQQYLDDFARSTGIKAAFTCPDLPKSLPLSLTSCLYRIAQEGLRNVVKHAAAERVEVALLEFKEHLRLSIHDDGVGFDPDERSPGTGGLGLISMRERALLVKGEFSVQSSPGSGTLLTAKVPLS